VARAIGAGLQDAGATVDLCPVADGGEGTMTVLLGALGGHLIEVVASDPLGRPVACQIALLGDGRTAVVEVAQASGLDRLADDERDGISASSHGTGELVARAVALGADAVLVAAGGSATTDGGRGAITAIEDAGGLHGAALVVLCDVASSFDRSPALFGPQKGADAAAIATLEARLDALADALPRDPRGIPMTGAAGGLSGGLWGRYGAQLIGGAPFVLEQLDFVTRLRSARAVIVGEGRLDATTLEGKIAAEIAHMARAAGVPCHAVVGRDASDAGTREALGLASVTTAGTLDDLSRAGRRLARLV
jgi:glycerate kinase